MSVSPRFKILETLGAGSYGAVYLAEVVGGELSRQVAIKMLHAEHARRPRLVAKLRDEARILSLVRHRAIVQVQDLVEADGGWAIVMEHVPGVDLATAIAHWPLPARAALEVIEEAASALHAAASQADRLGRPLGLVHRDVKPSNLRVTPAGEVKLLDFGVAHAEFDGKEAATFAAAVGTLPYMAPERFEGRDTSAGDVYALGVTLFELVAGAVPGNEAGSPERAFPGRKLQQEWRAVERASPDLVRLIEAMLAPAPADRPSPRDVARRCRELSVMVGGLPLADWAEANVEAARPAQHSPDARVGTFVVTGASALREPAGDAANAQSAAPDAATWAASIVGQDRSTSASWDEPVARATSRVPSNSRAFALGVGGVMMAVAFGSALLVVGWLGYRTWTEPYTGQQAPEGSRVAAPAPMSVPTPKPPAPTAPSAPTAPLPGPRASSAPKEPRSAEAAPEPKPESGKATRLEPPSPQVASVGRVSFSGDPVVAVLYDGDRAVPGLAASPGTYRAEVTFADGTTITVPGVVVRAADTVELSCNARFKTCSSAR